MIGAPADVPVDPDAQQAHDWLAEELAKAPYQEAQPTLLDRIAQQLLNWLADLIDFLTGSGQSGEPAPPLWLLGVLVPVLIIGLIAFLVYGVPRLRRRSRVTGELFGEHDERDADALRRAASDAAARGDYSAAVAELFRAIARGLAERTLVTTFPGTTAGEFARRAAAVFPAESDALTGGARDFDSVRYLGHAGTREQWEHLAALDERLRATTPALDAVGAVGAVGAP
ncbi:MAG: DUF4129 domain-containing protein [Microbacteriaceae bacterium]|nr:DUF4129 domain-containing protein [Microbacteriaceae bacterium]